MCMCTAMDAYKTTRRRRLAKQPREAERIVGERFGGLSLREYRSLKGPESSPTRQTGGSESFLNASLATLLSNSLLLQPLAATHFDDDQDDDDDQREGG